MYAIVKEAVAFVRAIKKEFRTQTQTLKLQCKYSNYDAVVSFFFV